MVTYMQLRNCQGHSVQGRAQGDSSAFSRAPVEHHRLYGIGTCIEGRRPVRLSARLAGAGDIPSGPAIDCRLGGRGRRGAAPRVRRQDDLGVGKEARMLDQDQ